MDGPELIGFAASGLTTASFVPQVLKTVRTRSTADISHLWLAMFGSGIGLWLLYGLRIGSWPIIAGNAVTLALVCVIAWVKFMPTVAPLKEPA